MNMFLSRRAELQSECVGSADMLVVERLSVITVRVSVSEAAAPSASTSILTVVLFKMCEFSYGEK